jgi:hypothetical protein
MSVLVAEVLSAETLREILVEGRPVEEVVAELFASGAKLADCTSIRAYETWDDFRRTHSKNASELTQLEGESTINDSSVVVLTGCPMADEMKKLSENGSPPAFHKKIVDGYMEQNPGSNAILHPGCIAHQVARQLVVKQLAVKDLVDVNYYQLACRSGASGKIAYDENGLAALGMTKEQAESLVSGSACLYVMIRR